jgi:hypothetical protein
MLSESIQLNPYYPWWFNAGLSIYHFQHNEMEDAIYWAEKVQKQSISWEALLKAAAYSELGNHTTAKECMAEIGELQINLDQNLEPMLRSFLQSEALIQQYVSAIRKIAK